MARGASGRVVLEVDPKLKHDLYVALTTKDLTLREWFIEQAEHFLSAEADKSQMRIPFQPNTPVTTK